MVKKIEAFGYDGFRKKVEETVKQNKNVQLNILFTGNKDSEGKSWCPDCNNADPHLTKALEEHGKADSIFLEVQVGDRQFWKDLKNPFRSDRDAKVSVIPTIIRWNSPARLDGDLCAKKSLLEMFFTEDEEVDVSALPKSSKPKEAEKSKASEKPTKDTEKLKAAEKPTKDSEKLKTAEKPNDAENPKNPENPNDDEEPTECACSTNGKLKKKH